MDFRELGWRAQVLGSWEHGNELSGSINARDFIVERLLACQDELINF
jgi:hypothetical protein